MGPGVPTGASWAHMLVVPSPKPPPDLSSVASASALCPLHCVTGFSTLNFPHKSVRRFTGWPGCMARVKRQTSATQGQGSVWFKVPENRCQMPGSGGTIYFQQEEREGAPDPVPCDVAPRPGGHTLILDYSIRRLPHAVVSETQKTGDMPEGHWCRC